MLAGSSLTRMAERHVAMGVHEPNELGPALEKALVRLGIQKERVELSHECVIASWNRSTTEVDLVVLGDADGQVELAAELKVWDIISYSTSQRSAAYFGRAYERASSSAWPPRRRTLIASLAGCCSQPTSARLACTVLSTSLTSIEMNGDITLGKAPLSDSCPGGGLYDRGCGWG